MSAIVKEERIGGQRLILGDCLNVMPELGRFDAVVTDPPYGIKRGSGMGSGGSSLTGSRNTHLRRYAGGEWDNNRPSPDVFLAILTLSLQHIVWGGNYFTDLLPVSGKWLFWDKCQTMPSYSDGELAWTTIGGDAVKQFTYNGNGLHAKEKNRVHPTQKPIALMEWCIGFLTDAQTILDHFMGSGTTLVACQRMGRMGTGIELDPEYFKIACERVHKTWQEPDMFVQDATPKPEQMGMFGDD